jgi:hypothetical protein
MSDYLRTVRAQALRWWGGAFIALAGVVAVVGSHLGLADGLGPYELFTEPLGGIGRVLALSDTGLARAIGFVLAGVGVALTLSNRWTLGPSVAGIVGSGVLIAFAADLWRISGRWEVIPIEGGAISFTRGTGLYALCIAAGVAALGAVLTLASLAVMPPRYAADDLEWEDDDDPARGDVQMGR